MTHAKIRTALQWLQTLINSPAVAWSPGQHEAATAALEDATGALIKPRDINLPDGTTRHNVGSDNLSDEDRAALIETIRANPAVTVHDRLVARFKTGQTHMEVFSMPQGCTDCAARIATGDHDCAYPDCSRPDKLDPVRLAVQNLLDAAMSARVVVTIERKANTDGTAYYEVDTRPMREDYQNGK